MKNLVFLLLLTISIFILSCSETNSIARNSNAVGVQDKTVNIPSNIKYSSLVSDIYCETSLLLTLPAGGDKIFFKEKTLDERQFDDLLAQHADTRTPEQYQAYIKSDADVDYGKLADVFKRLREREITPVSLIVNSAQEREPQTNVLTECSRQGDVLEIKIPPGTALKKTNERPDPLTLLITADKDNRLKLNEESIAAADIPAKLGKIFIYRLENGYFREGTHEVEQTVHLKVPRSMPYGEVAKLIDLVRGSGAVPIYLNVDDLEE